MQLPINFLISEIPLFDKLDFDEIKEIEKRLVYRELEANKVIYKQGAEGRSVCFVVEGALSVIKRSPEGDATIATVGKGQAVGEMAMIDGLVRSADVVAVSPTSVLLLKREDFEAMVEEHPAIGVKVIKSLARALSATIRDRSDELARLMLG